MSFEEFILDQLATLPNLRCKARFGGRGLYSGDWFFGILFVGRFYFKVDEPPALPTAGAAWGRFPHTEAEKLTTMSYYEVPTDAPEDRTRMAGRANRAQSVAARFGRHRTR